MNIVKQDIWQYLKTDKKPIVLYGMGNGADKIIKALEGVSVKPSGVFATDGFVRDKRFHGMSLTTYSALKERFGDMTVLLCFGSSRPEVLENINRIAAEQELLVPDVPVYGDGLFDSEYAAAHTEELLWVYSRLADEKSRETLENTVNFKLSGKPEYLYRCEVSHDEPFQSFLMLCDDESYLDLGAYNGDTVLEFIQKTGKYKSITAVEPDNRSFKKLTANTGGLENLTLINACVGEAGGTAGFSSRKGRGSGIGIGEDCKMISVDSLNGGFSFIKADVEGSETAMLKGAESTILRCRPKMQIACYHRTGDLTDIPRAVCKIRNDYRIYMRHFPGLPAWDINYYFI